MGYTRYIAAFAAIMVVFAGGKIAYEQYELLLSTTSTTTTTSTSTTSTTTTTTTTTTSTTSTTSTTYLISYTTTLWGHCHDGLQNQNELGVDCGGECSPCKVECTRDSDCGTPHYDNTVCLEGDVYKPLVEYECMSPWMINASCRIKKRFIIEEKCHPSERCLSTNYCPGKRCIEARCLKYPLDYCTWTEC
ncbi:MAG: hypothetical protein ABH834_07110 [Candidatus Altiarchaeota archaeon]